MFVTFPLWIHGAGIYANIGDILMVNVTIYTYHTWILWVMNGHTRILSWDDNINFLGFGDDC
jgi:hypothetical protein